VIPGVYAAVPGPDGDPPGGGAGREALAVGHADRLGHGIRVLDDRALVDEIRAAIDASLAPSATRKSMHERTDAWLAAG
jgi:hypothetical protein